MQKDLQEVPTLLGELTKLSKNSICDSLLCKKPFALSPITSRKCEAIQLLSTSLLRSLTTRTISTFSSACHCGVHLMARLEMPQFLC